MSTERDRRQAARRQRQKKTRVAAATQRAKAQSVERASLAVATETVKVSAADAARWPVHEAWISEVWDRPGATVRAGVSRRRADGVFAAAFFSVDARSGRITSVDVVTGVPEGRVNQALVGAAEGDPMLFCNPGDVAALAADAIAFAKRTRTAHEGPLDELQALLAGLPTDEAVFDVRFGDPDEEEETETIWAPGRGLGILGRVKRLLGLG